MSRSIGTLLGAISVSLLATLFAPASFAAQTTVLCKFPLLGVTTGLDGTAARLIINCSGASSARVFRILLSKFPIIPLLWN